MKVDSCPKCGQSTMVNSVPCTKCGIWVHDRCAKTKTETSNLAKNLVSEGCVAAIKEFVEPAKELSFYDQVEFVKFLSLRERVARQWWKRSSGDIKNNRMNYN